MPKWKKDAKEFTVSVNFNESRGYQSSIPKPVIEALGEPENITFVIDGKSVKIKRVSSDSSHTPFKVESSNKRTR
ncbi:MAG: hypothetical protein K8Q89_06145 [Nitrosarchaeum sp.]|nr:hypothetical protein [Nitrosarchaeum sp.]